MEATLIGPTGQTTLGPAVVTIGRMPGNQLLMTDHQSSSHHAEIRPEAQGFCIVDLGSTNGTYVNEERLAQQTPRLLVAGDRIRIGNTVFTYEVSGAPLIPPTVYLGQPGQNNPPAPAVQATVAVPPPGYAGTAYDANAHGSFLPPPPVYQQPYPPAAFPQQNTPPAPARKKSRRGLWIALAIIALLLIIGVALAAVAYANRSTPARTLMTFCTDLTTHDYQGAYQQLSASAQSKESEARFAATLDRVGGVKECIFSGVDQNGSTATALVTLTVNISFVPPINYDSTLISENGTWKIDTLQARK